MHPLANIALNAARKAGNYIARSIEQLSTIEITEKEQNDFASEVDINAEKLIIEIIHKSYPQHAIIAEESGEQGEHDVTWIIDPLDGTRNFLHGFPHYAVSIAVREKNKLTHGVIYDPIRQEIFIATRGGGARLNDRRIRVSNCKTLEESLLATGFPFKRKQNLPQYLATFEAVVPQAGGIRRAGSAALDLAYVAAGRVDGFWEFGLNIWDYAAGIVIIKEAGGLISDLEGTENYLQTGNILAGNPKIFKVLLQTIKPIMKN